MGSAVGVIMSRSAPDPLGNGVAERLEKLD
jgi:hypothetical protein